MLYGSSRQRGRVISLGRGVRGRRGGDICTRDDRLTCGESTRVQERYCRAARVSGYSCFGIIIGARSVTKRHKICRKTATMATTPGL